MQCLSFCKWLIPLSIMPSGIIHVVIHGRMFFYLRLIIFFVCIDRIYFIRSSVDRPLWSFQILANVHNAAMSMEVHIFFWETGFNYFGCTSRHGSVGSHGNSILIFLWNSHPSCHSGCNISTSPPTVYKGSNFSTSFSTSVVVVVVYNGHPNRCEVISHFDFNLHFPDDKSY